MAWRRCLGWVMAGLMLGCSGGGEGNGDKGDAAVGGDSGTGQQADGGDSVSGDIVWGVLVHQTDAPPAAVDALTGLHVAVSDRMQPPGPLSTTLDWAAAPNGLPYVQVLHGCTADTTPQEILLQTCAVSDTPGCLELLFRDPGVSGAFTHPNGDVCQIQGGDAELFVRALPPSGPVPTDFAATDTATGTFRVRCDSASGVTLWLDGTFELRATRMYLLC